MEIPINDKYRLSSDEYQWVVQKRRSRKGKVAYTTFAEPYFKPLWQDIDKDKLLKRNEIEAIKALEDIETLE